MLDKNEVEIEGGMIAVYQNQTGCYENGIVHFYDSENGIMVRKLEGAFNNYYEKYNGDIFGGTPLELYESENGKSEFMEVVEGLTLEDYELFGIESKGK